LMIEAAVLRCLCLIENYENYGNMYLGELIEQGPTGYGPRDLGTDS
jgi:hypothetical protein